MKKQSESDNIVLSLRIRGAEAIRFNKIYDDALKRNPYIDRSDVIRELLGLKPADALKESEIAFFRTGAKEVSQTREEIERDYKLKSADVIDMKSKKAVEVLPFNPFDELPGILITDIRDKEHFDELVKEAEKLRRKDDDDTNKGKSKTKKAG